MSRLQPDHTISDADYHDTLSQLNRLKLSSLKDVARAIGLPLAGRKADIFQRVENHFAIGRAHNDQIRMLTVRTLILKAVNGQILPSYTLLSASLANGSYADPAPNQYNPGPASVPGQNPQAAMQAMNNQNYRTMSQYSGPTSQPYRGHQLYFKSSPFYKLKRLIQGCPIIAREERETRGTANFQFVLNNHETDLLSKSNHSLFLLCGVMDRESSSTSDALLEFPHPIEIHYNDVLVKDNVKGIKNKPGTARPANLTPHLRYPPKTNKLQIVYAFTKEHYLLYLYVVETISSTQLMSAILDKPHIIKEATIKQIQQDFGNDEDNDDIMEVSTTLDLKCPLTFGRMKYPCKSIYCQHIQCFDGLAFLQLQEQVPTWSCPICAKMIDVNDLSVSDYIDEIIKNTGEDDELIEIDPSGTWSIRKEEEKRSEAKTKQESADTSIPSVGNTSNAKQAEVEIISLDSDSESDYDIDIDNDNVPMANLGPNELLHNAARPRQNSPSSAPSVPNTNTNSAPNLAPIPTSAPNLVHHIPNPAKSSSTAPNTAITVPESTQPSSSGCSGSSSSAIQSLPARVNIDQNIPTVATGDNSFDVPAVPTANNVNVPNSSTPIRETILPNVLRAPNLPNSVPNVPRAPAVPTVTNTQSTPNSSNLRVSSVPNIPTVPIAPKFPNATARSTSVNNVPVGAKQSASVPQHNRNINHPPQATTREPAKTFPSGPRALQNQSYPPTSSYGYSQYPQQHRFNQRHVPIQHQYQQSHQISNQNNNMHRREINQDPSVNFPQPQPQPQPQAKPQQHNNPQNLQVTEKPAEIVTPEIQNLGTVEGNSVKEKPNGNGISGDVSKGNSTGATDFSMLDSSDPIEEEIAQRHHLNTTGVAAIPAEPQAQPAPVTTDVAPTAGEPVQQTVTPTAAPINVGISTPAPNSPTNAQEQIQTQPQLQAAAAADKGQTVVLQKSVPANDELPKSNIERLGSPNNQLPVMSRKSSLSSSNFEVNVTGANSPHMLQHRSDMVNGMNEPNELLPNASDMSSEHHNQSAIQRHNQVNNNFNGGYVNPPISARQQIDALARAQLLQLRRQTNSVLQQHARAVIDDHARSGESSIHSPIITQQISPNRERAVDSQRMNSHEPQSYNHDIDNVQNLRALKYVSSQNSPVTDTFAKPTQYNHVQTMDQVPPQHNYGIPPNPTGPSPHPQYHTLRQSTYLDLGGAGRSPIINSPSVFDRQIPSNYYNAPNNQHTQEKLRQVTRAMGAVGQSQQIDPEVLRAAVNLIKNNPELVASIERRSAQEKFNNPPQQGESVGLGYGLQPQFSNYRSQPQPQPQLQPNDISRKPWPPMTTEHLYYQGQETGHSPNRQHYQYASQDQRPNPVPSNIQRHNSQSAGGVSANIGIHSNDVNNAQNRPLPSWTHSSLMQNGTESLNFSPSPFARINSPGILNLQDINRPQIPQVPARPKSTTPPERSVSGLLGISINSSILIGKTPKDASTSSTTSKKSVSQDGHVDKQHANGKENNVVVPPALNVSASNAQSQAHPQPQTNNFQPRHPDQITTTKPLVAKPSAPPAKVTLVQFPPRAVPVFQGTKTGPTVSGPSGTKRIFDVIDLTISDDDEEPPIKR